jgi:Bacterial EndoU nuclease
MDVRRPVCRDRSRVMSSPASRHGLPEEPLPTLIPSNLLYARNSWLFIGAARRLGLCFMAMTLLCWVSSFAGASEVPIECKTMPRWTKRHRPPQVNQVHVFCGEWKQHTPIGFHSRPGGVDPHSVTRFIITQPANAQGIYGGSWSYAGQPHAEKFSTMFPDACSVAQVLNSIVYAATHPNRCPVNAPRWAVCGPNQPPSTSQASDSFCVADDGTSFLIAMAKFKDGRINSAFPLR